MSGDPGVEIRGEMQLPGECDAMTMLLDSTSAGGDPRADRMPRAMSSSDLGDGDEEEEEEDAVGGAWRSDDDGSDSEAPRVVGGKGLVLSAEERRRLDEALEDLDDGSSVDSVTWNLVPKGQARRRAGEAVAEYGPSDAELYSENTRLLAAKRRADAKVRAVEAAVDRLKSVKELPEVDVAIEKMARYPEPADWADACMRAFTGAAICHMHVHVHEARACTHVQACARECMVRVYADSMQGRGAEACQEPRGCARVYHP